jgi:hypothetical protein
MILANLKNMQKSWRYQCGNNTILDQMILVSFNSNMTDAIVTALLERMGPLSSCVWFILLNITFSCEVFFLSIFASTWYSWNIVESGVKHKQKSNPFSLGHCIICRPLISQLVSSIFSLYACDNLTCFNCYHTDTLVLLRQEYCISIV